MFTPGEAKFIQNWTQKAFPEISDSFRAAGLAFTQKYPPGVEAELDAMDMPLSVIALISRVSTVSIPQQSRWFEQASFDAAAESARDEAGVERHLVGPMELGGHELRAILNVSEHIGSYVAEELIQLRTDIDEARADGGDYAFEEHRTAELLTHQDAASSITTAIHTYISPQIPE